MTKRSVSRITPSLKLRPVRNRSAVPTVISVLPPPMSTTTAVRFPMWAEYAGGQVDQPRFLGSGDHLHAQTDGAADRRDEIRAISGLANGARGRGDDFVHAVRCGNPREL